MGKQVSKKVQHVEDKIKDLLIRVQSGQGIGKGGINSLKARKLIVAQVEWKELEFKEYNFNAKGLPAESGHLHPLLKQPFSPKRYFSMNLWTEGILRSFIRLKFIFATLLLFQL
ncbi:phenylalanine--tRNA ligase alpha subunit, cytoplasmic-like [Hibiscus syriacus]|uniref:phenylalanine--tRNA ligase alpha subunit, cytoplasmic-like n=1 Tax=Hibiscus syriacus TaxID=106335 RepID=UPI001922DFBD|nr:phenylalanine--tRNA ligase alpha subunit, cytoplasmic-like [Hibiscus syriacus]